MADSRRKLILLALAARLQTITRDNGYNTDAGERVEHGQHTVSGDDTLPRLALVAGVVDQIEKNLASKELRQWALAVSGLLADDPTDPLAVEDLLADIKRALFRAEDPRLGGLAVQVQSLAGETVTDPEEGGKVVAVTVPFAVRYEEGYGEP
ncbi:MAG TPA: hypothetical protein VFD36_02405 [Kofleriaceae bacterium]|nr:hypothetical protein [Gaiellaceae bacterium]HZJ62344.1 hypothetical protein [Kofleriaceae bacterium]